MLYQGIIEIANLNLALLDIQYRNVLYIRRKRPNKKCKIAVNMNSNYSFFTT